MRVMLLIRTRLNLNLGRMIFNKYEFDMKG
jgi:hypothetical protein